MKYTLKFKNKALFLVLTTLGTGAYNTIQPKQFGTVSLDNKSRAEFEDLFLHEAIAQLLDYVRAVHEGKEKFFDLKNSERYSHHKTRFEESLKHINHVLPYFKDEVHNRRAHTNPKYTAIMNTLNTVAELLKKAQERWVTAIQNNTNVLSLGFALSSMEDDIVKTKDLLLYKHLPALGRLLKDHTLRTKVTELEHIVNRIFTNADDKGRPFGLEHLQRRFKLYP